MFVGKLAASAVAAWIGICPSCEPGGSGPRRSTPAPAPIAEAFVPGAKAPMPPLGSVETRTSSVFDSGSATMRAAGKAELRRVLGDLPKHHPILIEVFNHDGDRNLKIDRIGPRKDLSVLRAAALAEYLQTPDGGGWTVRSSTGRGYDHVNGRPADRRMVFTSLPG